MWKGTGGSSSKLEFIDVKDQLEQQQLVITQLKEILCKTEKKNITEEQLEEYANTLTRMSARINKSRMQLDEITNELVTDRPSTKKNKLLRQRLEENKLLLEQRGKFQKGIEETVTQLKAQFDDSQQLISQTPLNSYLSDGKSENYSIGSTSEELFNVLVIKDHKLAELNSKIQKLEANVKEKDSVINARTKVITLMTESLNKKGKNALDALDDMKEQMRKMQEDFVSLEMDMKAERQILLIELYNKNGFITTLQNELETYKAQLENSTNFLTKRISELENELSQTLADLDKLSQGLKEKDDEINQLQCEIEDVRTKDSLNSEIEILKNRIIELEELNSELTKFSSEAKA